MKYLMGVLLSLCLCVLLSCGETTTADTESTATELALQGLSKEVIVKAIDTVRNNIETAAIEFNPYYRNITFSAATNGFVSFDVSDNVFEQPSGGVYTFKLALGDDVLDVEAISALPIITPDNFHELGIVMSFYVHQPQTSSTFLKFGLSQTDALVASFTSSHNVSVSGPLQVQSSLSVSSRSYSVTVSANADAIVMTDYYMAEDTAVSANTSLCVDDLTSGDLAVDATATITIGTGGSVSASYSSDGAVDFDTKYAYVTVPDIESDGTVNDAGETVFCAYFGDETNTATILSGVPSGFLPTGKTCSSVSHLVETVESTFFTCVAD